jgi:cellulose synthase/poly-beta-1,6-N-acetylglucosamine synthase-like glycosyltransferase
LLFTYYAAATICLTLLYVSCIILYAKCWKNLPFFENTVPLGRDEAAGIKGVTPKTFISVLIPARNESENILPCLNAILAGNYPKDLFEIIVIDDHSDDATPQLVANYPSANVRLIELKNFVKLADNQPFKKRAIEAAIGESRGKLIVTTDGDCIAPPEWLHLIASFYEQSGKRFIAAPVNFYDEKTAFERFQSLDYIGMMGVTGAGVSGRFTNMCNGANLAYEKALFHEVGGFKGIDHVASGDDMLLMQKIARFHPDALGFLKNPAATVLTKAKPTIGDFMSQRLRWASKSSSYTEVFTVLQLVMVFVFCWNILLSLCLSLVYAPIFLLFLFQFTSKSVADYLFLRTMARFFNREDLMRPFLPPQYMHVLYIIVVGSLANFKKTYQWKGRTVK